MAGVRQHGGRRTFAGWIAALAVVVSPVAAGEAPLQIVVMDPLALQLSCACVPGTGQRRYEQLGRHLGQAVGRLVKVTFDESLALALGRTGGRVDLIIGKDSVVWHDAARAAVAVRPLAALSDANGRTEIRGVILVRKEHPAKAVANLAGKMVCLGPVEDEESHGAIRRMLKGVGVNFRVAGSIDAGAVALGDGEVDAAAVPDFLPPLLEGCGKVERGSMRVIGGTEPVPFIRVFASADVDAALEAGIARALASVAKSPGLLAALESRDGFVFSPSPEVTAWTDWRGPGRAGVVPQIPATLPAVPPRIWAASLTGPAMAGPAATADVVIVPDKSADARRDIFRCLGAKDGAEIWRIEYDAPDDLEYSNAPRATPVIHGGLVYLQGALGDLHCVELATGRVMWRTNIFRDFGAQRLNWGASIPPLVVDDALIIAPGAKDASLAALDRKTGKVLWKTPGHAAAYSAFIAGTFGGVRQIVGYDAAGIGGWEPATGRRLWEVVPPDGSDFNVATPVAIGQRLLLATENNATRLYEFDGRGVLRGVPVARNADMAPDTCTPAVAGGRVFGAAYGELFCLDANDGLRTVWRVANDMFQDHSSVVAGRDRVLIWTIEGDLLLVDATAAEYRVISHLRPFGQKRIDSMAHPAFVGDRIYLRSKDELLCLRLGGG